MPHPAAQIYSDEIPVMSKTLTAATYDDIDLSDDRIEKRKKFDNEQLDVPIDREEEKEIVRALDRRMLPLFCVFYFTDFLDRANIGNAKLGGLQEDLKLTASQLSTIISGFYITYILFEVPSNVILKRTSATIWLSSIMLVWGVITLAMGFIKSFGGLLAARLLLGAAESGYIPGILYQMSRVYKPTELSCRIGFLLCMSFLSGIVSGPIAYGTSFLEGRNNLYGWQYLFILEGVPTIVLSIVSFFFLFDNINQVSWLTSEQKSLQHARMKASQSSQHKDAGEITWRTFATVLTDWKTYAFASVYFLHVVNFYSFSIFSPVLIDGFGFSILTSQLLSAPPNLISAALVLVGGYIADRYNKRSFIMLFGFSTMAIGYLLLLVLNNRWGLYGAMFIIPVGMSMQSSAVVGWSPINYYDLNVRAVAVATIVMIGNSGGIVSSYLYPSTTAPHYVFGNAVNLGCAVLGAIMAAITGFFLRRENRRRDKLNELKYVNGATSLSQEEEFRYYV